MGGRSRISRFWHIPHDDLSRREIVVSFWNPVPPIPASGAMASIQKRRPPISRKQSGPRAFPFWGFILLKGHEQIHLPEALKKVVPSIREEVRVLGGLIPCPEGFHEISVGEVWARSRT
jgi:hypothetical protein